jgi:hypothetical protein
VISSVIVKNYHQWNFLAASLGDPNLSDVAKKCQQKSTRLHHFVGFV